ncbi:MAG: right-handed parallel beta-helix repeat-containing protein [Anaerolineae bacterium]|nr:right-handed parallel beta-helix repeat-containing protein [Anaerolineae bacterium]
MKFKTRITIAVVSYLFLLLAMVQTTLAQGDTFYVDVNNGSNTTGDGSAAKPWQTIQYAANQVSPGDTVLINPGTYSGGITVDISGTETGIITFKAKGSGVIIEGSGSKNDAFFITEADYITVEGLTIQHADRAGLRISLSDHVTIRDCTFADNVRWGVFTDFSDYTLIENIESYGAQDEHGIYISNSSDYPTIRNSRLHHNYANGIHMNGDISIGGDGIISEALIEGNVIYENGTGGGSGINMDGVTDSIIRNNLLYNNHASGISIFQIDGGSGSQNNRILNNTIIVPSDARWAINIPDTVDTGNKVFNNILLNNHSWKGSILIAAPNLSGFESDYNIVVNRFNTNGYNADNTNGLDLTGWQALGYDTHSIIATANEIFVDAAAGDYRLKETGSAVDAGITLPDVPTDIDGNSRPAGSAFDIGAYEYGSMVVPPFDHFVYLPIILVEP